MSRICQLIIVLVLLLIAIPVYGAAIPKSGIVASSSSVQGGDFVRFDPNKTLDGFIDGTHRWSSEFTDDEWISFDLGTTYNVTLLTIYWEAAFASQYKIQYSQDGMAWADFILITGSGGTEEIPITGVTAKHIRILGISRGTQYGYSIFEVYFEGTPVSGNPEGNSEVHVRWQAPTENVDGTTLEDLSGYEMYWKWQDQSMWDTFIDLPDPGLLEYTLQLDRAPGTSVDIAMKAYNSQGERSVMSNIVSKTTQASEVNPPGAGTITNITVTRR